MEGTANSDTSIAHIQDRPKDISIALIRKFASG